MQCFGDAADVAGRILDARVGARDSVRMKISIVAMKDAFAVGVHLARVWFVGFPELD